MFLLILQDPYMLGIQEEPYLVTLWLLYIAKSYEIAKIRTPNNGEATSNFKGQWGEKPNLCFDS